MASPQAQPQWMVGVYRGGLYQVDARAKHPSHQGGPGALQPFPNSFGGHSGAGAGALFGRGQNGVSEPADPAMPWAGMLSSRYMGTLTHMLGEPPGRVRRPRPHIRACFHCNGPICCIFNQRPPAAGSIPAARSAV